MEKLRRLILWPSKAPKRTGLKDSFRKFFKDFFRKTTIIPSEKPPIIPTGNDCNVMLAK